MTFTWEGLLWEGVFSEAESLDHRAGVYVVWCQAGDSWKVLDVGDAEDIRQRIEGHDRKDCWRRNCSGTIRYAAYYATAGADAQRAIEARIRAKYSPPCGER